MGQILEKTAKRGSESLYKVMIERYNNANEMVNELRARPITDSRYEDKSSGTYGRWEGVKTYDECLEYLRNGYQPSVDSLKESVKPTVKGESKRITFENDIVGGMPIVPLALIGVPNCMIDTRIKPIKAKVLDIYYDITCSCSMESEDIIDAGKKLLATILKFEQQGYKFNLYAVQTYSDSDGCDMLVVKVKSSNQPLDLKRMSYPLTHTSFFRVLGFDWYSRTPKGKYRYGYGHNIAQEFKRDTQKVDDFCKQLFGKNSIYIAASILNGRDKKSNKEEYISEVINPK